MSYFKTGFTIVQNLYRLTYGQTKTGMCFRKLIYVRKEISLFYKKTNRQ